MGRMKLEKILRKIERLSDTDQSTRDPSIRKDQYLAGMLNDIDAMQQAAEREYYDLQRLIGGRRVHPAITAHALLQLAGAYAGYMAHAGGRKRFEMGLEITTHIYRAAADAAFTDPDMTALEHINDLRQAMQEAAPVLQSQL